MATPEPPMDRLLRKAKADERLVLQLLTLEDVSEEHVGFHCQQAVEKGLKAVLFGRGTHVPRTHDLELLAELVKDSGSPVPSSIAASTELTRFAVAFRYDSMQPAERAATDRAKMADWASSTIAWAEAELARLSPPATP